MAAEENALNDYERRRALVAKLNLMDDIFCSAVLEHKDACEYLISALLGKKITLLEYKTQYSIRNIVNHSIVADVLVKDEDSNLYDVEVNTGDGGFHERRLRYYNAAIDWSYLDKGKKYQELPDLYMLYITTEDPFKDLGLNKNHYEVVQSLKGTDAGYSDGVHIHYFNTQVKDDDNRELTELLDYMANTKADSDKFGALSDRVSYYKIQRKGVESMCKIVEEYAVEYAKRYAEKYAANYAAEQRKEGEIEGRRETKLELVEMMINDGFSLEKALRYAKLDRQTYEKYLKEQ